MTVLAMLLEALEALNGPGRRERVSAMLAGR